MIDLMSLPSLLTTFDALVFTVTLSTSLYFTLWFMNNRTHAMSGFQAFLLFGVVTVLLLASSAHFFQTFGFDINSPSRRTLVTSFQAICLLWVVLSIYHFHRLQGFQEIEKESRLLQTLADSVFVVEPETARIVDVNETACDELNYPREELLGVHLYEIEQTRSQDEWLEMLGTIKEDGETTTIEGEYLTHDRDRYPVEIHAKYLRNEWDQVIAVARDITQRKRMEQQLQYRAIHDDLTGLPNRKFFHDYLQELISREQDQNFALFFVDLNRFKEINDGHGHKAGDEVLRTVADRLRNQLDPDDTVARLGGDEFVFVVENLEEKQRAREVARQVLDVLEQPIASDEQEVMIGASIGIVLSNGSYQKADVMLRDADLAMYEAKNRKGSGYVLFTEEMRRNRKRYLRQKDALRTAFDQEQFELKYQPIIDLADETIIGVEALVRWRTPQGVLRPNEFLQTVKKAGLIDRLDRWVLGQACQQAKEWNERLPDHADGLKMCVNFSPENFRRGDVVGEMEEIIHNTGLDPSLLKLELIETEVMKKDKINQINLTKLRNLGISLVLDDFGTGYSSFEHLHRLPIDTLKVDQSFVSNIDSDPVAHDLVRTTVTMASDLDKDVIAEGIETRRQYRLLKELNCPLGQGYYYSKPIPPKVLTPSLSGQQVPPPLESLNG